MTFVPTQRKTYMMLSKENAVQFIVEPDTHKIISTFDRTHDSTYKTDKDNKGKLKSTYSTTKNAMFTFRFQEAFINSKK